MRTENAACDAHNPFGFFLIVFTILSTDLIKNVFLKFYACFKDVRGLFYKIRFLFLLSASLKIHRFRKFL